MAETTQREVVKVWSQETMGIPAPPPFAHREIREAAEHYVQLTERYDREICHHIDKDGQGRPHTRDELKAIREYALRVRRETLARLEAELWRMPDFDGDIQDVRRRWMESVQSIHPVWNEEKGSFDLKWK